MPESLVTPYGYEGTVTTVKSAAAGYFAAQKEAGTPVQIAYQLATPKKPTLRTRSTSTTPLGPFTLYPAVSLRYG